MNPPSRLSKVNASLFVSIWIIVLIMALFSQYATAIVASIVSMGAIGRFLTYALPTYWDWIERCLLPNKLTTVVLGIFNTLAVTLLVMLVLGPISRWKIYRESYPDKLLVKGDAIPLNDNLLVSPPARSKGQMWVVLQQPNKMFFPLADQADATSCSIVTPDLSNNLTVVKGPTDVGEAKDGIKSFKLLLVQTDDASSKSFQNTLKSWCQKKTYPGMKSLPEGSNVVDELQLKLLK